jgi:hypothetical protein
VDHGSENAIESFLIHLLSVLDGGHLANGVSGVIYEQGGTLPS